MTYAQWAFLVGGSGALLCASAIISAMSGWVAIARIVFALLFITILYYGSDMGGVLRSLIGGAS